MNTQSIKNSFHSGNAADADKWVRITGHIGIAAMAVVYLVIGFFTVKYAFSAGGQITDARGALSEIGSAPYGQVLLAIVGAGLISYAIFRVIGAWKDIDNHGHNAKGILGRAGFAIGGLVYGALGASVFGFAFGGSSGGQSSGGSKQSAIADLMSQPAGQWLVGILGATIIGYALFQVYKAVQKKFFEKLRVNQMSDKAIKVASSLGTAGIAARSVVLGIIGYFIVQAAITHDPSKSGGLKDALAWLASQNYGPILLGVVALGLFLFGIYALILARYRQFLRPA